MTALLPSKNCLVKGLDEKSSLIMSFLFISLLFKNVLYQNCNCPDKKPFTTWHLLGGELNFDVPATDWEIGAKSLRGSAGSSLGVGMVGITGNSEIPYHFKELL